MVPSILLVLLRGTHMAAVLSVFGVLVFQRMTGPSGAMLQARLRRLAAWSAVAAIVLGIAWLAALAGTIAGSGGPVQAFVEIPDMLAYFRVGRLLLARLVLLTALLGLLMTARWGRACLVLIAAAAGLQPLLAHAGAISGGRGALLIGSEIVHMWAVGAWAGGLAPLLLALRVLPAGEGLMLLRRFSMLGAAAVAAIIASGVIQLLTLTGGLRALVGTTYGVAIAVKLGLFALALTLAGLNRLVLMPRFGDSRFARTRRAISASVGTEAVLAFGITLAAGWLASLAPGQ